MKENAFIDVTDPRSPPSSRAAARRHRRARWAFRLEPVGQGRAPRVCLQLPRRCDRQFQRASAGRPSNHHLRFRLRRRQTSAPAAPGRSGINGKKVGSGRLARTIPFIYGVETADVGMDLLLCHHHGLCHRGEPVRRKDQAGGHQREVRCGEAGRRRIRHIPDDAEAESENEYAPRQARQGALNRVGHIARAWIMIVLIAAALVVALAMRPGFLAPRSTRRRMRRLEQCGVLIGFLVPADGRELNCRRAAPEGMVWIPGGEFSMGAAEPPGMNDASACRPPSIPGPIHRVYVDGFWMDATEVTNAQFARSSTRPVT